MTTISPSAIATPESAAAAQLRERIANRSAVVGIIGLGYVGLPLARALHDGDYGDAPNADEAGPHSKVRGFRVIGFDTDPDKITHLNAGESYLKHLGDDFAQVLADSGRFTPTTDFTRLGECDVIIVCVPTPVGRHLEPDLSYIIATAEAIGRTLRPGQLLVLESTTYPRTTRDDFLPAVQRAQTAHRRREGDVLLEHGQHFWCAFSPEREDPGRKSHNTKTIPKLVGGLDQTGTELASGVYSAAVAQVIPVASAEIAEAAKILENVFRAVNIAMVNELKMLFDRMGIDVWEVIQAAATKPFGFMPFFPGPGLGGHCIPIDPFYLTWKAKEYGMPTRFIELAGEVNHQMPHYVITRCAEALNDDGKAIKGSRVLIMGMAYKPNVDDVRETPSAEIAELLLERGANVQYHDPHVPRLSGMRHYPNLDLKSVPLTDDEIARADLVLIATDHEAVDYARLASKAGLIVDTRNAMAKVEGEIAARVVKA